MYRNYLKKYFDLAFAVMLLCLLGWLWLLIIFLYVITFEDPGLFRQTRIGWKEHPFTLFKFRTLKNSSKELQHRRFFLGNVLRFTSLDELPQLLNVIRGEMSLIGPRPLPVSYLPLFSEEQRLRHTVRPGITGWAQVNGRHGIAWPQKFKLDLYYVSNLSFILDAKILVLTGLLFISFKRDVSLDEKPFMGEQ